MSSRLRVTSPPPACDFLASFFGGFGDDDGRDAAAGLLDRLLRALGGADAGDREFLLDLAGEDDLGALGAARDEARLLEAGEVDRLGADLGEVARAHFGRLGDGHGEEAALGQAPLQRHLAALEADLVVAAGAGLLALVAASRGLAQARADAAADAAAVLLGARGGLDVFSSIALFLDLHQVAHLVDHSADRRACPRPRRCARGGAGPGPSPTRGACAWCAVRPFTRVTLIFLPAAAGLLCFGHLVVLRRSLRPSCRAWPRSPRAGAAA